MFDVWMFVEDVLLGAAVQHQRRHSRDGNIDWGEVSALLRGNRSAEQWKVRWEDVHNGEMYGYEPPRKKRGRPRKVPIHSSSTELRNEKEQLNDDSEDVDSSDDVDDEASNDLSEEAYEDENVSGASVSEYEYESEENTESSDEGEWNETDDAEKHRHNMVCSLIGGE